MDFGQNREIEKFSQKVSFFAFLCFLICLRTFGKQDDDEEEEEDDDGEGDDKENKQDNLGLDESRVDSKGSDILITENSFENVIFEKIKNFRNCLKNLKISQTLFYTIKMKIKLIFQILEI